jgi:YHS domain-containing protein
MLSGLFRLVLIAFVIYIVFVVLRIVRALKHAARSPRPPASGQKVMVKDEVCGTYLPRDEALHEVRIGRDVYFCSEDCQRKSRTTP